MTTSRTDGLTAIAHDPDVPFVVLDPADRIVARFKHEHAAIDYATKGRGKVVDSTPQPLPIRPGWYEASEYPIGLPGHAPYELRANNSWYLRGNMQSDSVMRTVGTLTRLGS